MSESVWKQIIQLRNLKIFENLSHDVEKDYLAWKKWYGEEKAESIPLPKSQADCAGIQKLLLLRAIRPDRLTNALTDYVRDSLGDRYIDADPFDMNKTYSIMSTMIPVFFVLFPGVDPTKDVEAVGMPLGKSINEGTFTNISMG